ncbi:terpene synthase 10-like [Pistacia vera]|uniref:terpene synthase 10-like n=1 Tax=Pistacia vera TaxID=55513 RepID=UPI001263DFEE|nr:terpene synthase 10-like [Pistacia vera]
MALYQLTSMPSVTFKRLPPTSRFVDFGSSRNFAVPSGRLVFQCMAATRTSDENITRRSANYQPSIWPFDFVQSLGSNYRREPFAKRVEKLKKEVRLMLHTAVDSVHQLELIDDLQRLGVSYHFENEIRRILNAIYNNNIDNYKQKQESLYAVALEFRLLRQHGYDVPTEIFNNFRDKKGNFVKDCKGILSLYEAAFLLKDEENVIFHDVRGFTTSYLKEYVRDNKDQYLATLVSHALELPLNWRMLRLEARWFIDVYEARPDMKNILLELAKLDYNMVQATHQDDLKYSSRWWKNTGLGEKLSFARDRLMENFLWTVGVIFKPEFGYCRRMSTKVNALITTIDDVYDVYGTLDELELFTDVVERWDIKAMEQLPQYMKICFLALYNAINEMGFDALKEQGVNIIPYLTKAWADICKCYLLEAKWYHSEYIPFLAEYIDNAWISISAPVILVHAYFFVTNPITNEALESLEEYSNIIRWSAIILRLADDLGTSSDELKRGDVAKSIQCYMHETGASEEDAREHIQEMITEIWMKMNRERLENPHLSNTTFIEIAMNLARMAQCMYQHGDGHGIQDRETKDRVLSLLVNPIAHM